MKRHISLVVSCADDDGGDSTGDDESDEYERQSKTNSSPNAVDVRHHKRRKTKRKSHQTKKVEMFELNRNTFHYVRESGFYSSDLRFRNANF